MNVAPSPGRSRREAGGDRVIRFLVVRPGVLVRRVIGAGHPAAGQADREAGLPVRLVPAVPAGIGQGRDRREAVEVPAARSPSRSSWWPARLGPCSGRRSWQPPLRWRKCRARPGRSLTSQPPGAAGRKQATRARPITRTDHRGGAGARACSRARRRGKARGNVCLRQDLLSRPRPCPGDPVPGRPRQPPADARSWGVPARSREMGWIRTWRRAWSYGSFATS